MNASHKRYDRDAEFRTAVRELYDLDDATKRLIAQANYDLYYGPSGGGLDDEDDGDKPAYPGFEKACKLIATALDQADVGDVYFDTQSGFIETSEPEWCDGCDDESCVGQRSEDYACYARSDVVRALVGALAEYL